MYTAKESLRDELHGIRESGLYKTERVIVTGETTHLVWDVKWDGAQFVTTQIGTFPNQPEDGIFVTAAILNPGCDITNSCGGRVPEPGTLLLVGAALAGFAGVRRKHRR